MDRGAEPVAAGGGAPEQAKQPAPEPPCICGRRIFGQIGRAHV